MTANVYSRIFDARNKHWSNSTVNNKMFLKVLENYANDLLQTRGHVFLNDVYDMLGMPRSQSGAVTGWFKEPGSKSVVFDMVETGNGGFFISFDVDGIIYNKLDLY